MTVRAPHKASVAVASAVLALVLSACSNGGGGTPTTAQSGGAPTTSPSKAPSPTTTSPSPADVPPSGTYLNGPAGTPHTYIVVTDGTGDSFSGSVVFLFQDGSTSTEFSFTATARSGSAMLITTGGGPGMIAATYSHSVVVLTGCISYLEHVQSSADCTFTSAAPS